MFRPVDTHGSLAVHGARLLDQAGKPVILRGVSLYWSQWRPRYFNHRTVEWLRDDWKINVIRAPLGVAPDGYLDNPSAGLQAVETVINAAIDLGLYVIVDWHAHDPHTDAAMHFFSNLAVRYKNVPNLIYEIWNEPGHQYSWAGPVRAHHLAVIDAIRSIGADNLIVLGTQNWSRDVDVAAYAPIDGPNLLYALHFYAASHGHELRVKADRAVHLGLPLIVTEWGASQLDGGGTLNPREARRWWDYLEARGISYVNWSISDIEESSAALLPGASADGGWPASSLSPSGRLTRDHLRQRS